MRIFFIDWCNQLSGKGTPWFGSIVCWNTMLLFSCLTAHNHHQSCFIWIATMTNISSAGDACVGHWKLTYICILEEEGGYRPVAHYCKPTMSSVTQKGPCWCLNTVRQHSSQSWLYHVYHCLKNNLSSPCKLFEWCKLWWCKSFIFVLWWQKATAI